MLYINLDAVFAGYKARALAAGQPQPWIVKVVLRAPERPDWRDLLERIESLFAELCIYERKKVTARFNQIIPVDAQQWRDQYDEGFRDALVELLGWKWLRKVYPSKTVGFCPVSSKKGVMAPDLGIWDGEILLGAMECKKVNFSDEEKAWLGSPDRTMRGAQTSTVEPSLDPSSPLSKKLMATIQNAKDQLDATLLGQNKFIFMSLSLDTHFWNSPLAPSVQQFLRDQACKLITEDIRLIVFEDYQSDALFF